MAGSPRARSPAGSLGGSERKRRRKVLSCYDCRRRKLQCDRAVPACGRCTRTGQSHTCSYVDDANDGPTRQADVRGSFEAWSNRPSHTIATATPPSDVLSRIEYQDRRIKQLEAALGQSSHGQAQDPIQRLKTSKLPLTPETIAATEHYGATLNEHESMILRGKSFKTQFYGSTNTGTLLAHIPDLHIFTKDTFENNPALSRIKRDMRVLEERVSVPVSHAQVTPQDELRALLAVKEEADALLKLYLETYEHLYHILHLPTFWREYDELWSNLDKASPRFVATMLLILASAQCLASTQSWLYSGKCSAARKKAVLHIQACERWLRVQSQKHVTVADFQIRFLLHFAQQVNACKNKRIWTRSGDLLRFCMSAGLHRNPDLIRKRTSALDKEMRRRLWAAVIEIELQASFNRGMIPTQWPLQADCPPPSNISDDTVGQTSEHLPPTKPAIHFTTSSYLTVAAESISLRHSMATNFNSIRQTILFDDVKRLSEDVESHLERIPQWTGAGADIARARLALDLRQYLIFLHARQVRQADNSMERNMSRMMLVENAVKTIDIHRELISNGCYALEMLCSEQVRAALSICQVATTADIRADSAITMVIEHHASRVMEETALMLTDKIVRLGCEQKELWIVLAAHGVMKSRRDPSQRVAYMQEAVEKIAGPYYKMMACQEEVPENASTGAGKASNDMSHVIRDQIPVMSTSNGSNDDDIPGLGNAQVLDDLADWTFEEWVFNPGQMAQDFVDPSPYEPTT